VLRSTKGRLEKLEELAGLDCFRCGEMQKAFADFLKRNKR
jgi:hypothetical protein